MSYHLLSPQQTFTGGGAAPAPSFHLAPNLHFNSSFSTPHHTAPTGPHLNVGTFPTPTFTTQVAMQAMPVLPDLSKPPGLGLLKGTAVAFIKAEDPSFKIPASIKVAGTAFSAYSAAKKLTENAERAIDQGQTPAEAYTCQSVAVLTEEVTSKALKGLVVNGIPAYMTAAVASPPLALTIPVVLPLIPPAYQGAQAIGAVAGYAAEVGCHKGFEAARQYIQGVKK